MGEIIPKTKDKRQVPPSTLYPPPLGVVFLQQVTTGDLGICVTYMVWVFGVSSGPLYRMC